MLDKSGIGLVDCETSIPYDLPIIRDHALQTYNHLNLVYETKLS